MASNKLLVEAAAFPPGTSACLGLLGPLGGGASCGSMWNGWRPTLLEVIPDIDVSVDAGIYRYVYLCIYITFV